MYCISTVASWLIWQWCIAVLKNSAHYYLSRKMESGELLCRCRFMKLQTDRTQRRFFSPGRQRRRRRRRRRRWGKEGLAMWGRQVYSCFFFFCGFLEDVHRRGQLDTWCVDHKAVCLSKLPFPTHNTLITHAETWPHTQSLVQTCQCGEAQTNT